MNNNSVYDFPFEPILPSDLIVGNTYYIKLHTNIMKKFIDQRRRSPVYHWMGTFVGLHTEKDTDYAIFHHVQILNKSYKNGNCNLPLVRYPEGFLAATDCDTFSDRTRVINEVRYVYFSVSKWVFGEPVKERLFTKKALNKIQTRLNNDTFYTISSFLNKTKKGHSKSPRKGGKGGKGSNKRKTRKVQIT